MSGGDMQTKIELSGEAKLDLQWWVRELPTLRGRPLFEQQPALVIYSDASRSGWGWSVGTRVHRDLGYSRICPDTLTSWSFWRRFTRSVVLQKASTIALCV